MRYPGETWQQRRLDDLAGSESETVTGTSIDLWFTDLADWSSVDPAVLAELGADEHERASRIPDTQSRREWQRSRSLLRRILSLYLPALTSLEIELGAHGKPRLRTSDRNPLHFNLSHHQRRETGSGWILAISRAGEVGVDLEALRPVPNAERLAQRVFTPAERESLAAASVDSPMRRDRVFLDVWTRKEALLKAVGDGFVRSASALHVGSTEDPHTPAEPRIAVAGAGVHEIFALRSPRDHLVAIATAFAPTHWRLIWLSP